MDGAVLAILGGMVILAGLALSRAAARGDRLDERIRRLSGNDELASRPDRSEGPTVVGQQLVPAGQHAVRDDCGDDEDHPMYLDEITPTRTCGVQGCEILIPARRAYCAIHDAVRREVRDGDYPELAAAAEQDVRAFAATCGRN